MYNGYIKSNREIKQMGFNIDRLTGKYKIDGHYVGKATYNLVLTTARGKY